MHEGEVYHYREQLREELDLLDFITYLTDVYGDDAYPFEFLEDSIPNDLSFDTKDIQAIGDYITFHWESNGKKRVYVFHLERVKKHGSNEGVQSVPEYFCDNIEWFIEQFEKERIIEVSQYQERVLRLTHLSESITERLAKHNVESSFFSRRAIDYTVRLEDPLLWDISLAEAILYMRKELFELRDRWYELAWKFRWEDEYSTIESNRAALAPLSKTYLLMICWVWYENERLTDVIPKSQNDTETLMSDILLGMSIAEWIEFLEDIHKQIQDNTRLAYWVKENNALITRRLAMKLQDAILYTTREWITYETKLTYLYRLAEICSGRNPHVKNEMRDSQLATEILIQAIALQEDETSSLMQSLFESDNFSIDEPYLQDTSPSAVYQDFSSHIKRLYSDTLSWLSQADADRFIVDKFNSIWVDFSRRVLLHGKKWSSFETLWYLDLQAFSILARINTELAQISNKWTVQEVEWVDYMQSEFTYRTRMIEYQRREEYFKAICSSAFQASTTHFWNEIDRNFDDTFWEKLWQVGYFMQTHQTFQSQTRLPWKNHDERMAQFWITEWSIQSDILKLYNSIRWNGDITQVSDTTQERAKVWAMLAANVAATLIGWFGIIGALRLASITPSLITQWAIIWTLSVPVWYALDAGFDERRDYANSEELTVSIISELIIAAWTWAVGWVIAQRFGNPDAMFYDKKNLAIFTGDLAILWVATEVARVSILLEYYYGKGILIEVIKEWENLLDTLISQKTEALHLHPHERLIESIFFGIWLDQGNIPENLDIQFRRAYTIHKILEPWYRGNIVSLPDFREVYKRENLRTMAQSWDYTPLFEAIESWSQTQLTRLERLQTS